MCDCLALKRLGDQFNTSHSGFSKNLSSRERERERERDWNPGFLWPSILP